MGVVLANQRLVFSCQPITGEIAPLKEPPPSFCPPKLTRTEFRVVENGFKNETIFWIEENEESRKAAADLDNLDVALIKDNKNEYGCVIRSYESFLGTRLSYF